MPIKISNIKETSAALYEAMRNDADMGAAFEEFAQSIADEVTAQYKDALASNDARALEQRGFRTLTSDETAYYNYVIKGMTAASPVQEFATMPQVAMPQTIIETVMKDIAATHPLLAKIKPQATSYLTSWVRNGHSDQRFAWGEVTESIAKEIISAFDTIDLKQGKLSGYAMVSRDMLELGPVWLDGYVRAVMGDAYACGLEYGICCGKGVKGEPIGLNRKISKDASINAETGYPLKEAKAVTKLNAAKFGELVAILSKTSDGRRKSVNLVSGGSLCLICNNTTYLTKVMPAVRVQGTDGIYRDSFPLPCEVIECNALDDNKAILCLADEYGLFVGGSRGIEVSDEFKFLEDKRVMKMVSYACGAPEDNNSAVVLDVTNLQPAVVAVESIAAA